MALTIIKFNLDINPGLAPQIINVSEYDINRQFIISITENGKPFEIPSNVNATIEGTLNQRGFQTVGTISNNTVSFILTEAMTASKGRAWVKIKLVQDNSPISTCGFWLNVDRAGVEADTVIGASGFEKQIREAVEDMIEGGGKSHAVLYTPMSLTPAQQEQARSNIGAFGQLEYDALESDVESLEVDLSHKLDAADAPTKVSELTNDTGFVTAQQAAAAAPVKSVNGKTGAVVLDAEDVGALPSSTVIPSKTSELVNDAHFATEAEAGVSSVNGKKGVVLLTTSDIPNNSGYITENDIPQEVPTADASANGMVLGVNNGRYTFVRMTGGISDVYMGGASIIQSGTTIAVIPNATTSSKGVVQLYDGTDSTSKGLVPTADALRGVAQRVGNLETRSANWLTETQIKELIDSMVQEQIAMYQRRVFALEDNKKDIDITSLSDLTSSEILYGNHWKQVGTNSNFGAVLYNPESKTIGGSSSDLIYLKRGYIIGVSKNSWFVTSAKNWYCSHVFLSYPKMQAIYAYDEENNIRYIAADIPAEIVEQAKVLAEDFLSQIESLETEI